jgi:energy-coupling factor transport system permease protein
MLFNTPGEHIMHWPFDFIHPSYEGFSLGITQVLRITSVLGILSIILEKNTNQQLISGLYSLIKPLSYVGLDARRFAARLWLTLYYVELRNENNQEIPMPKHLADSLEQVLSEEENDNVVIELEHLKLTRIDYVVLLGVFTVSIVVIVRFVQ